MSLFAHSPSFKTPAALFPVPPDFDPCAKRAGAAETSLDAHARVAPKKRQIHEQILTLARRRGDLGLTVHEAAEALGIATNSVSGRLFELRAAGTLKYKLDQAGQRVRRRGAYVLCV